MPVINNGVLDGVRRIGAKVRELTIDGGAPGAPLGFRMRGATQSGPPTTGTWKAGDEVRDRAGNILICTVGGTGLAATWASVGGAAPGVLTTAGDLLYENATPAPARLAVGSAHQFLGVSGGLPAWQAGVGLLATTGSAGVALINGTQTLLTWTAPADGNLHVVTWSLLNHVTSAETGGVVVTSIGGLYTSGNGPGGNAAAGYAEYGGTVTVPSGDTFSINQSTALTAGAATAYAQMWGN